jgi:hypothetical protein
MVNLSKADQVVVRLEKDNPRLVTLAKSAGLSLKKYSLDGLVARVVLVLDASGSMQYQYSGGNVQAVLDRVATLALNFDDDSELEVWAFGTKAAKLASVTLKNLDGYVQKVQQSGAVPIGSTPAPAASPGLLGRIFGSGGSLAGLIPGLGYDNEEPELMQHLLKSLDFDSPIPTFIVFITDGGIFKSDQIAEILRQASRYPAFWQYVGLGGSSYGILEKFDTLKHRYVDNAGFFAIDDFRKITDQELFDRLLKEFPTWLKTSQVQKMLNPALRAD